MKVKFSKPLTRLGAGMSAYLLAANAYAQGFDGGGGGTAGSGVGGTGGVGDMATSIAGNFWQASDVISTASYVVGAAFGMAGVMKLKQHAENPGNVNMTSGLGRIGAGAALVALPWVINTAFGTAGVTDQNTSTGITGSSTNRFND